MAFLGWEWTQQGLTPDTHYGHKNVVRAEADDANIPTRPIADQEDFPLPFAPASPIVRGALGLLDDRMWDRSRRLADSAKVEFCGEDHTARDAAQPTRQEAREWVCPID